MWKHLPRYWPCVRGIHRSPVNSPRKGQWRGALMFSLICAWIKRWVNNREAGDLRRYRAHYDVIVMKWTWSGVFKAVRGIAGLPRQTRSVLRLQLPGLAGNEDFHTQHERRFDNLFYTMLSIRNPAVSFIVTKAFHNTVGILGRNRAFLSVKYQDGRLIRDFLVEQIRELIRARDGSGVIENFQVEEIILVLDYVSTYWCLCYVWGILGWYGFDWLCGVDCDFFPLVLCLNCANLYVPCCNWLRINNIYIYIYTYISWGYFLRHSSFLC